MKDTGVWSLEEAKTQHKFSETLAKIISKNFTGLIWDLGCGNGAYVDFLNKNDAIDCNGIDGTDFKNGKIVHDLTKPFVEYKNGSITEFEFTKGTVMCLEVAEHIPKEFESELLDNIDRLCEDYLIISWATVGQGGFGHVNEQDRDYVLRTMNARGYKLMNDATNSIREAMKGDACWWFQNSLYIFERC